MCSVDIQYNIRTDHPKFELKFIAIKKVELNVFFSNLQLNQGFLIKLLQQLFLQLFGVLIGYL